jgi:hypothetical protein
MMMDMLVVFGFLTWIFAVGGTLAFPNRPSFGIALFISALFSGLVTVVSFIIFLADRY